MSDGWRSLRLTIDISRTRKGGGTFGNGAGVLYDRLLYPFFWLRLYDKAVPNYCYPGRSGRYGVYILAAVLSP